MLSALEVVLIIQYVSILILAINFVMISSQRTSNVQRDLLLLHFGLLIAVMAYTLELQCTNVEAMSVAVKFSYAGKPIIVISMFWLILDYCRIELRRRYKVIMMSVQVAIMLLVYTFEKHTLYYSYAQYDPNQMFPHLVKGHGTFYSSYTVLGFIYGIAGFVICIRQLIKTKSKHERRILYIFISLLAIPYTGLAIYLTGAAKGYDTTILGYSFGAMAFYFMFKNLDFFETIELATDSVIDYLEAGLIVYDEHNTLIHENNMAKRMGITDQAEALCISREYFDYDGKKYRIEKLPIENKGRSMGYAYYVDNETSNYNYQQYLAEEKRRADAASDAKTQFLSSMSHDIRTPMNAILGMAMIALLNPDDKEKVEKCLNQITSSGNHLIELINEVLDINKIESGKMELSENPFDLLSLIDDIDSMCDSLMKSKKHTFTIKEDVEHSTLIGDKSRLSRVLMNLISNSVKYTDAGGEICLDVKEVKKQENKSLFRFKVIDNGMGMSEEFLPTLFEPFTRAKEEVVYQMQGTGLGMTITKEFTELMGGKVNVQSTLGEGTTFEVLIPFKYANPEELEVKDKSAKDLVKMDFTGKRILLVEDNAINAEIATEILTMARFEVDHVSDGTEAVDKIQSVDAGFYDIIFMDIEMPKMNGYDATRAIRSMESVYAQNVPIVAMTANAFAEDKKMAKVAGMNDHISKPLDFNMLIQVLSEYCS